MNKYFKVKIKTVKEIINDNSLDIVNNWDTIVLYDKNGWIESFLDSSYIWKEIIALDNNEYFCELDTKQVIDKKFVLSIKETQQYKNTDIVNILEEKKINIVSCWNCGDILVHDTGYIWFLKCNSCWFKSDEHSDFPDVFY